MKTLIAIIIYTVLILAGATQLGSFAAPRYVASDLSEIEGLN